MAFISALDPALLFYRYEDWQAGEPHFLPRLKALDLHRNRTEKHGLYVALSTEMAAEICNAFPWDESYGNVPEFRDLRIMLIEWLTTKARYIDTDAQGEVTLEPTALVCQHAEDPKILDAWKNLLRSCLQEKVNTELEPQVATWETPEINR